MEGREEREDMCRCIVRRLKKKVREMEGGRGKEVEGR